MGVSTKVINHEKAIGTAASGAVEEGLAIWKPSKGGGLSVGVLPDQVAGVRQRVSKLIHGFKLHC